LRGSPAWAFGSSASIGPSVHPADSKTLDSHQQLVVHDMSVLENLMLDDVAPRDYDLIALMPTPIRADASPVGAIHSSV
jgi:arylformamidase